MTTYEDDYEDDYDEEDDYDDYERNAIKKEEELDELHKIPARDCRGLLLKIKDMVTVVSLNKTDRLFGSNGTMNDFIKNQSKLSITKTRGGHINAGGFEWASSDLKKILSEEKEESDSNIFLVDSKILDI